MTHPETSTEPSVNARAGSSATADVVILDVRTLPPRQRHEQIFAAFVDLAVGEALRLVNDHDPKPLHYQFLAEYPGEIGWEYLEAGPEVWQVRISRRAPGKGAAPDLPYPGKTLLPVKAQATAAAPPTFFLPAIFAVQRAEDGWAANGRSTRTLVNLPNLRVIQIALRQGARLAEHRAPGQITIHTLGGKLRLHVAGATLELPAGELLPLERAVPHDVEALEESVFLLTIAGGPTGDFVPGT
jgi:uncharacterized protein (DUF2249 family)/quercetin dioxygenase-like cupin family protein